jgi:hypothetical protein
MRIRFYCPACLARRDFASLTPALGTCPNCGRAWAFEPTPSQREANVVDRCALCGGRAFFVQRDFDQRVGCAVMAASILLALWVGWRFGWVYFTPVLLATVLIDWILAVKIGPVTICYRCDAEYRDVAPNIRHGDYDPHIAERYAARKTLRAWTGSDS